VVEPDRDDWAVWVHSEDHVDKARELLNLFVSNPTDGRFQRSARRARQIRVQAQREEEEAEKRIVGRQELLENLSRSSPGWLSIGLIAVCIVVGLLTQLGENREAVRALQIAGSRYGGLLPEVRGGEVWRLITPIFLHFSWWHLLFNLMWLYDLGGMIERRVGAGRLTLLVILIGIGSNLGQYLVGGPGFGGMSGVVYGLLGYVWMRSKFDPASGLFLHPTTVVMMLAWFGLCLTGAVGHIANAAHGVGLVMGVAWGFLASRLR
jgi:GlpG protein